MTDTDFVPSVEDARQPFRPAPEIIVGVDDDGASRGVLLGAARQSRLTGLPLRVVHVWQIPALETLVAISGAHHYRAAAAADARARATRRVVDILGDLPDVRWTLEVIQGAPGPALVARSATAELLVLGTGRHAGLRRAAIGSVSRYVMTYVRTPVLMVPATEAVPHQVTRRQAAPPAVH